MAANNILPFATANTNILSQADYVADSQRTSGNVPGVARSQLVNKTLRQTSVTATGFSQFCADNQSTDIVDTLTAAQFSTITRNAVASVALSVAAPAGNCRLSLSGGNLVLSPFGGTLLFVNGANRSIPSGGVSLAATGLTVGTTYYIYASWSGSAVVLEASTTGHSTDTSTGVEIKTGDATRTLVGMARTVTGPAWKDDYDQRFVLSWYNRQARVARKQLTGAVTLTAGPSGIDALKTEFICWSNSVPSAAMTGGCQVGTGATYAFRLGLNGSDIPNWLWTACLTSSEAVVPIALTELAPSIAEGYNFITLAYTRGTGSTTGVVTGTFNGNTNVQVQIQG